jgi:hypothetical protein
VQQVDGAELVFSDAVRTSKVIGQRALGRVVVFRRVSQMPKYIIDRVKLVFSKG